MKQDDGETEQKVNRERAVEFKRAVGFFTSFHDNVFDFFFKSFFFLIVLHDFLKKEKPDLTLLPVKF